MACATFRLGRNVSVLPGEAKFSQSIHCNLNQLFGDQAPVALLLPWLSIAFLQEWSKQLFKRFPLRISLRPPLHPSDPAAAPYQVAPGTPHEAEAGSKQLWNFLKVMIEGEGSR